MFNTQPRSATVLSVIIIFLAIIASVSGIAFNNLYRDNELVTAALYGNDLVTLVVAVPVMVCSLFFSARGSTRAQALWLGSLLYMAYNFAFYLFGTAFNSMFLVYTALFALSVYAMAILLRTVEPDGISGQFHPPVTMKWISGYMLFVGIFLGLFHTALSLGYVFNGEVPEMINLFDHPTNLIAALDLTVVVPLHILAAVLLWQGRPWGYLLAVITNVQGAIYNLALTLSGISEVQAGVVTSFSEAPLWAGLAAISLLASYYLLSQLQEQKTGTLIYHEEYEKV